MRTGVLASFLVGIGVGGFADGIVLHQLLQWHHLLSGVEPTTPGTLPWHVLWDGIFHATMLAVLGIGLALAWTGSGPPDRRRGAGWFLIGLGVFHLLDGILFHWLLGLHHIRMHEAGYDPVWDVILFVFGLVATVAGAALARRRGA